MIDSQTFIILVGAAVCVLAAMLLLLRMAREKSRLVGRYRYLKAALARNDELQREAERKREAIRMGQLQLTQQADFADATEAQDRPMQAATTAEPVS